jgi:hypothetical protein
MVRSNRVSGFLTALAKTGRGNYPAWKTALTDHASGCFERLHVFSARTGVPLASLISAINRGTLTDKQGLVIGPGILGIHRCQWASQFGGKKWSCRKADAEAPRLLRSA